MSDAKLQQNLLHMKTLAGPGNILSAYVVGMLTKAWNPAKFNSYHWLAGNGQMIALFRQHLLGTAAVHAFDTSKRYLVNIQAETVGTGTHGAFIDYRVSGDGPFVLIRPHEFLSV